MKKGLLLLLLSTLLATLTGASAPASTPPPGAAEAALASTSALGPGQAEDDKPYTLSAAYPNPFRNRTRFDLRVNKRQNVSIGVYNLLGQRVRTLYDGPMRAGDERTFTFKADGLPSGLYLYRVEGETFTAARRVTLVR